METEVERKPGCGIHVLYNGVFGRRSIRPRRTVSTSSVPIYRITTVMTNLKLQRAGSEDTTFLDTSKSVELPSKLVQKPITKTASVYPETVTLHQRKPSSRTNTTSTSSSSNNSNTISKVTSTPDQRRRQSNGSSSISHEHIDCVMKKHSVEGSTLVRAKSSGNIILSGQFDHSIIKQPHVGKPRSNSVHGTTKYTLSKAISTHSVMGNIMRTTSEHEIRYQSKDMSSFLYKTVSKRIDPETLKLIGNEEYRKGRFSEALTLYDGAIALDPNNASYRSNKSAALIGLGRLFEAVFECTGAIRIDPSYRRAHHRLATLYVRLGEGKKALYHFKQSGFEATSWEITKAQVLQTHFDNCIESKNLSQWNKILKETELAISLGADSAQEIFSWQAEALLKLHRHQDADCALTKRSTIAIDDCTKFFGPTRNAQLVLIRAQVDMAVGRFDEAMVAAQQALQLDSSNLEVTSVARKIRAVSSARSNGNKLFQAAKFLMASMAYSEGLGHDQYNSVLLYNRAVCRFKLNQFEKAMEDCTTALNLRPSYNKARLRKAECNAKMERWVASIQDYEVLVRERPRDEELTKALFDAQSQLKKQRSRSVTDLESSDNASVNSNNERFRHFIASPVKYVQVEG